MPDPVTAVPSPQPTDEPARVITDREAMQLLAALERIHPEVVKGFVGAVLKGMPRAEYLRFVQHIERLRS